MVQFSQCLNTERPERPKSERTKNMRIFFTILDHFNIIFCDPEFPKWSRLVQFKIAFLLKTKHPNTERLNSEHSKIWIGPFRYSDVQFLDIY